MGSILLAGAGVSDVDQAVPMPEPLGPGCAEQRARPGEQKQPWSTIPNNAKCRFIEGVPVPVRRRKVRNSRGTASNAAPGEVFNLPSGELCVRTTITDLDICKPHLRGTCSQSKNAAELLARVLPESVAGELDRSPPREVEDIDISDSLHSDHLNALHRVRLKSGGPAFVHLVFDHSRQQDVMVPLRLAARNCRIWEQHAGSDRERPRALPPVIVILFCYGRNRWILPCSVAETGRVKAETREESTRLRPANPDGSPFEEGRETIPLVKRIAAAAGLKKHCEDFRYHVVDIGAMNPEKLVAQEWSDPLREGLMALHRVVHE